MTKRSLLASLMALSLLCGGLGVAEASVHVDEVTGGANEVYTTTEVNTALDKKADKDSVYTKADTYSKTEVNTALNDKADKSDVYSKTDADTTFATKTELNAKADVTALNDKANKSDVYSKTDADTTFATKTELNAKADKTDLDTANGKITELQNKTAKLSADGKELKDMTTVSGTTVSGDNVKAGELTVTGEIKDGAGVTTTLAKINDSMTQTATNKTDIATNKTDINDLKTKTTNQQNAIDGLDTRTSQISYDAAKGTTVNGVDFKDTEVNANNKGLAGVSTLHTTGDATIGGALKADSLTVENASNLKGDVTMDKALKVTGDTSLKKTDVDGALNVTGESSLKNTKVDGTLTTTGKATFQEAVEMDKGLTVTSGDTTLKGTKVDGKLTVTDEADLKNTKVDGTLTTTGKATFQEAVEMDKGLTVTNGETKLKDTTVTGDLTVTGTITTDKMIFGDKATNNYTEIDKGHITSKNDVLAGDATKKSSSMELDHSKLEVGVADKDSNGHLTMTADQTSIKNSDLDEKNYSEIVADKDSVTTTVKDEKGNTTSTKSSATEIRNYAKDKDGNKTINAQSATQNKSWAKDKDGNESSIVQTGKDITNTAEKGTITSKAKDIVNDASGNISNKSQTMDTTVTGKATESYGSLDTTVKGNETHIVKGTKTETVDGKVTENYKAGQETNVTGDQDIKVSGTQTTTATDINRNASSGMIDTIDNDYGTNKETKVAGETKTEVSIKGTGEKGEYIRGATQSRDYLIKGTLKNEETKTAEATSTEITDGTNTAATIQDAKNLAGSVTNGTETGISGIHANDDGSVSIDSAVAGGGMSSVINQKKDSIQSAVGDGTNSTVIHQDKDNVTIASSNGMVGLVGKDIVNNAQDTITNTAGTSITNQVNDSKVTTDANGTTFENNTPAVSDGGATTTKINGNQITTGRVNANELAVSDKDGDNTADLSVKAGEGVKASASDGTTTGSLDVTADEVGSTVKDASGKGSTFKQRIDAIMMESKDVSIKAEETLTNEAKDIVTNASNSITEKVGETNVTTKTTTSSKSEIQNADTITSVQQTENMVQSYVGKKDGSATNVTTNFANASANMVTENGQSSTVLNNKDGLLVRNTANGSSFITADGTNTGAALEWTNVKGNEISTGKVEANYVKMDYADVMNDLGVKGTTTTKTLKVTENATVGGTLDVTGKATFRDDVDIKKNLSVDGNATIAGDVTASSYKVGDKTYISAAGINANDQKITNVADGSISEGSKDAVNGGQLYGVKRDLEHQVDKVGANAAAMANLRPMEFDPSSKWNIAAAIGNYGSETAAALGAFYRPNDNVMVNLSTAFGTGENMVGGGVSVRLGKGGNKLSREESNALKAQVADLTARMDALLSVLNPNMSKDFPDVPENHWAYEAVSRLAGNDIVQGYPDGEFHGERTMTRYEMAEIIYNALSRGAEAERELVEEFKPELQAMAASEKSTAEKAEG